jgi:hypothetical protein
MDQSTRGGGDLITGDYNNPVNSTTGNVAWPHQILEPAYMWNDVFTPNGHLVPLSPAIIASTVLQSGRDYFNGVQMPGYTPYTYPHPLVTGAAKPQNNVNSIPQRRKQNRAKPTTRKVVRN